MRIMIVACLGLAVLGPGAVRGEDDAAAPLPIPLTRPEMKQSLEDLKDREIRIPLPELTEEDKAKLGDREGSYESRLSYHYLPGGDERRGGSSSGSRGKAGGGHGFSREPDPNMTLSYEFKTMLFWIVSRTNNCLY